MTAPISWLWAVPFLGLLFTFACAPLLAPPLWHRHYRWWTALWSLAFLLPAAGIDGPGAVLNAVLATALLQYLPFILLLGALFAVAGGLRITGTPRGGALVNTALLALGTLLASIIGSTGAALLTIRPLARANRHRRYSRHVFVFLILLVANVGGALTPLGNPPIFLGFLAGVPFFWPLVHLWAPTALVAGGLLASFYMLDRHLFRRRGGGPALLPEIEKLGLEGGVNLVLLALIIAAVMLRAFWHPAAALSLPGFRWEAEVMIADALLLAAALLSLALTPRQTRQRNDFAWTPMIEVAILFAGVFITLLPVTAMIAAGPAGPAAALFERLLSGGMPIDGRFYWATGLLSAFLDNAPAYLVFFDFAGGDAARLTQAVPRTLAAISAAAAYFGAFTYLGNAPNLLIKRLAERQGIAMPQFFGYVGWSILCLLPWLLLVQAIFFA
ncbi:MAG TPA: sodium:proton antiporter [Stellaceae bacterium]|nr:sodium:proton antiporter [Stellaceae bacterium]